MNEEREKELHFEVILWVRGSIFFREKMYIENIWKKYHESSRGIASWELKAYSVTLNVFYLLLYLQIFAIVV